MRMYQEGVASAEDIDKAMSLLFPHPIGLSALSDLVGQMCDWRSQSIYMQN